MVFEITKWDELHPLRKHESLEYRQLSYLFARKLTLKQLYVCTQALPFENDTCVGNLKFAEK